MPINDIEPIELTGETINSMIYEIRGQKVMLDFDLARIYGYETRYLNRQVKNNNTKFPDDFIFRLTKEELNEIVMCKKCTSPNFFSGQDGGTRKLPWAFTEQGLYMLMTVLKGDLATRQSIALVRAFKRMKDYIIENRPLLDASGLIRLVQTVDGHEAAINEMRNDLKTVMDNFIDESTYKHFLILDGEKIESDVAYQAIYKKAKRSIIVIDDYIDVKTMQLLKASRAGIGITVITDNKARNGLNAAFVSDSGLVIRFIRNGGRFHDRYVILDYKTDSETIYHCGASSKDSGSRITAINRLCDGKEYHAVIDQVLSGERIEI